MRLPPSLALTLAFSLSPLAQAASSDPVLAKADQLISQRQASAAFDLLSPLEDERAGDPDYDYLLGLAALESGFGGIAAFAFERCLAVDPKNGPCRVQMARTHLALGENGAAREELQAVQASEPPAEVKSMVSQYLGTLSQREQQEKRRIGFHAQLGAGYDSNVSSTTAETQIAIPAFGGLPFILSGVSTKQEDSLVQGEVGASLDYSLAPAWNLLAEASIGSRQYVDVDAFSSLSSDAGAGLAWRTGPNSVLAKLQVQDYRLDEEAFRSLYGALTQFQHAYSDQAAVSAYLQASQIDYHLSPDAKRFTLGTGYSRSLERSRPMTVYAGLYGGQEESDTPGVGIGQDFLGLRLGGSLALRAQLALTASLSVEQRTFDDGLSPAFLVVRKDTGTDLSLGAVYKLSPQLSLRPAYTYSNSDSNTALNDYDRHVVTFDLRFDL